MEPSSWPETLPSHRQRAIREYLIQGHKLASQLQMILRNNSESSTSSADDLAVQIMATFNHSLSMLNFAQTSDINIKRQVSDQVPANPHDQVMISSASNWDHGGKSEDSSECSKTSVVVVLAAKDRRGCYKRRKTSETCEKLTSTLVDDGHAWRKYGQKHILNAKHPRTYYRCTHKFEQGCKAKKQVQKTDQDDPPMYKTTYQGPHTCSRNNLLTKPPSADDQIILDSTTTATTSGSCTRESSSVLLSFESKRIFGKLKPDDNDSFNFPTMIKHHDDGHQYSKVQDDSQCMYHPDHSPFDYLTMSGLMTFDSASPMPMPLLSAESSDVLSSSNFYSCTTSSSTHSSFGMDHMMNFDDFHLEFCS